MDDRMVYLICVVFIILGISISSCADEFGSVTEVDKFRVMGVSVSSPEIRPEHKGPVDVRVLWHDPKGKGRPVSFAWVVCIGDVPTATGYQSCELLDPKRLPPVVTEAENGGDTFSIPAVICEEQFLSFPQYASRKVTVIVLMCAGGSLPSADDLLSYQDTNDINSLCVDGEGLSAYKSIEIANGNAFKDPPNTNPEIVSISLNGTPLTPIAENGIESVIPDEVQCPSEQGCDVDWMIAGRFSSNSYQAYTTVEFDEEIQRTERPYISWFATSGQLSDAHSISDSPSDIPRVQWDPEKPGSYRIWAVGNDKRGGVDWLSFKVNLVAGTEEESSNK